ncbi:MAG: hypothetical protein JW751_05405 [Polyangiaceae bacterium]|nr:hypothetical protein [Polyangiaceae bacterium]
MVLHSATTDPPGPTFDAIVLMSDTTDEGERLGAVLRTRGYSVVDVPIVGLANRARLLAPSLVICDLDTGSAATALTALADLGQSPPPRVLVFSDRGPAAVATHPALERVHAELFPRPIDVFGVMRRVEALLGAPSKLPGGSLMPPISRSLRSQPASDPNGASSEPRGDQSAPSHPRPPSRPPSSPAAVLESPPPPTPRGPAPSPPVRGGAGPSPTARATNKGEELVRLGLDRDAFVPGGSLFQPPLSTDLQHLLATAEQRIRDAGGPTTFTPLERLSPDAEIGTVLPPDVLEALDEPLDEEGDTPQSIRARRDDEDSDPGWTHDDLDSEQAGGHGTPHRTRRTDRDAAEAQRKVGTETQSSRGDDEVTPGPRRAVTAARSAPAEEPAASEGGLSLDPMGMGGTNVDGPTPARPAGGDLTAASPPSHGEKPPETAPPRTDLAPPPVNTPPGRVVVETVDPSTNPPPRTVSQGARGSRGTPSSPPPGDLGRQLASQPPTLEPPGLSLAARAQLARGSHRPRAMVPGLPPPTPTTGSSDPPRSVSSSSPSLPRYPAGSSPRAEMPRSEPAATARGVGRAVGSAYPPLPASVPPPSMPSNAFLAGPSLAPRVSSGPPMVAAMPIPMQEALDEPFSPPADSRPQAGGGPAISIPTSLQSGDAVRVLALLVRSRYTGAVALETGHGIQRAVLRDGDFVTASSGLETESLVAFLVQRGVLSAAAASNLARRVPGFGRHAGAALIAHGHLRQDELWPVLRAHAEWILGRMVLVDRGAASLEPEVPVRLKSEPAVFGGATGAEILVEIVRRVVPPEIAARQLGGPHARFGDGVAPALLGECGLPDHEQLHVNRARSTNLEQVLASAKTPDFAAVLYALVELGVLDRRPSNAPLPAAPGVAAPAPPPPPRDDLDEAAHRAKIAARFALVQEGDYFAVLGIARDATAYDVRQAYGELRAEFEPSRVLTAKTVDLRDEVATILEVLEEACEILGDDLRRSRYLHAIEAAP